MPRVEGSMVSEKAQVLGLGRPGFGPSFALSRNLGCSQLPHHLNWSNNLKASNQECDEV